jgi:hypothetical protein
VAAGCVRRLGAELALEAVGAEHRDFVDVLGLLGADNEMRLPAAAVRRHGAAFLAAENLRVAW